MDLRHIESDYIIKRFSNIYNFCINNGVDVTKDLIPVAPAAHYTIGGVRTGLYGETNIKGLFACGEVACTRVHGANRLASNSLLECVVFAKRAVDGALQILNEDVNKSPELAEFNIGELDFEYSESQSTALLEYKKTVSQVLNSDVGIVKTGEGVQSAINKIEEISQSLGEFSGYYRLKLQMVIDVSLLIARSSLIREESRGVHIREDYPQEEKSWGNHIVITKGKNPSFAPV